MPKSFFYFILEDALDYYNILKDNALSGNFCIDQICVKSNLKIMIIELFVIFQTGIILTKNYFCDLFIGNKKKNIK